MSNPAPPTPPPDPGPPAPAGRGHWGRFAWNLGSSWVGYAVQVAVTLALTPFVLSRLGTEAYGVWVVTTSLTGYYGLLALGLPAGVNQHLTRALAVGDLGRANRVASSGFVALAAVGAVALVIGLALAGPLPGWLKVDPGLAPAVSWCVVLVSLSSAAQCALSPFAAVLPATSRFDLDTAIGVATRLLTAGLTVFALTAGYGLVGLGAAAAAGNLADYLVRWRVAYRLVPGLRVSPRLAGWDTGRDLTSFGAWNFLVSAAGTLQNYADALLIAKLVSVAATAPYFLAARLIGYLQGVMIPLSTVLYPLATGLHARAEQGALRRLFLDGSRLTVVGVVVLAATAGFWAEDFFRLWVGDLDWSAADGATPGLILRVLAVGTVMSYSTGTSGQILNARMQVRTIATVSFITSLVNVAVNVPLILAYGVLGAAVGSAAAALIKPLTLPVMVSRRLGVPFREYVAAAWLRPAAVGLLLLAPMAAARWLIPPTNLALLTAAGALGAAAGAPLVLYVGLNRAERERFLAAPGRRFLGRAGLAGSTAARAR
ncbi:MAG: polysaccharide biosynthesis C-terminal domain-containing protein [Gemmataceae bacterium]|nr:polysaccharide biosynthesis C-terminal domain-containing protein [Gemmataceae bacterium]